MGSTISWAGHPELHKKATKPNYTCVQVGKELSSTVSFLVQVPALPFLSDGL